MRQQLCHKARVIALPCSPFELIIIWFVMYFASLSVEALRCLICGLGLSSCGASADGALADASASSVTSLR
jgi:hypothetical protein